MYKGEIRGPAKKGTVVDALRDTFGIHERGYESAIVMCLGKRLDVFRRKPGLNRMRAAFKTLSRPGVYDYNDETEKVTFRHGWSTRRTDADAEAEDPADQA